MRKAYTKPVTWATKALFEGPLLSETYVETGGNRTGIMNYTDAKISASFPKDK